MFKDSWIFFTSGFFSNLFSSISLLILFIRVIPPWAFLQQEQDLLAVQRKDSLHFFHPLSRWSECSKGNSSVWRTGHFLACTLCSNCCLSELHVCREQAAWWGADPIPDYPVYSPSYPFHWSSVFHPIYNWFYIHLKLSKSVV